MWSLSVHIYKYSQEKRRKLLRKLAKDGFAVFLGRDKTHYFYQIKTAEGMKEYIKRKG